MSESKLPSDKTLRELREALNNCLNAARTEIIDWDLPLSHMVIVMQIRINDEGSVVPLMVYDFATVEDAVNLCRLVVDSAIDDIRDIRDIRDISDLSGRPESDKGIH